MISITIMMTITIMIMIEIMIEKIIMIIDNASLKSQVTFYISFCPSARFLC